MRKVSIPVRLYGGWSDDLRASELATLRHIDAAAWLRMAVSLLIADKPTTVKVVLPDAPGEGARFLREPAGSESLMVRFLRYMSSEQLFALILSAQNFLPYARFTAKIRYQDLTRTYGEIKQGLVPERFSRLGGDVQSFETWLAVKLGDWDAGALCPSLIRFVREEACLLSDRTFINAIKHGRARTRMDAGMIAFDVNLNGVWTRFLPPSEAIWVEDWTEGTNGFQHCVHVETFDYRSDVSALHVAHLMMKSIINGRTAYLDLLASDDESRRVDFSLPCDIKFSSAVSRMKGLPVMSGTVA